MDAVSKYQDLFLSESRRHLAEWVDVLSGLSVDTESVPAAELDALFRHLHTLKGMASSMQYGELAELCHRLEDIVAEVRAGRRMIDAHAMELWGTGAHAVGEFLSALRDGRAVPSLASTIDWTRNVGTPAGAGRNAPRLSVVPATQKKPLRSVVDIDVETFDLVLRDTDAALRSVAEIERQGTGLEGTAALRSRLLGIRGSLFQRRFDEVQTIIERYPRLVEDLSRATNKRVLLTMRGGHLQLDRRLLETIDSVLVHLVTNAVDHGIEERDERPARKHAVGRVTLDIKREGDEAVFLISDDGGGLDQKRIRQVAEREGLRLPESLVNDRWLEIISLPGFSTRDEATLTSGRGVGLNAVLTTVSELGGKLSLSTEPGVGTTFRVRIPCAGAPLPTRVFVINHQRIAVLEAAAASLKVTHPTLLGDDHGLLHVMVDDATSFLGTRWAGIAGGEALVPLGVAIDQAGMPILVLDAAGGGVRA